VSSKQYFDDVSKEWDSMRQSFFSDSVRERMCDAVQVKAGETAADVGAGTGFVTEELLKRGLRVIAMDQSREISMYCSKSFPAQKSPACRRTRMRCRWRVKAWML
jgi:ubiquinone/menaquinone biosynthesis C-methylase UbiE